VRTEDRCPRFGRPSHYFSATAAATNGCPNRQATSRRFARSARVRIGTWNASGHVRGTDKSQALDSLQNRCKLPDESSRPTDPEYYVEPDVQDRLLGDIFRDVTFDFPGQHGHEEVYGDPRRFLARLMRAEAMLLNPTCSMYNHNAAGDDLGVAHPLRTIIPVVPLKTLIEVQVYTAGQADAIRASDENLVAMYLPAWTAKDFRESMALFYMSVTISEAILAQSVKTIQLGDEGRRQLKQKLGKFYAGVKVARGKLNAD